MIEKLVRKEILGFQPYVPGKPVGEVRRELGIKGKIIKLASNENPGGPSQEVVKAMKKSLAGVNRYPDGSSHLLRKAIAIRCGVSDGEIILGSGVDEIIELIGKTFFDPSDEVIVSEHAFIRYRMAAELMGCRVVNVPMKGYRHDLIAMAGAVTKKTKAIFIANPNNPTGTYNTSDEIKEFLAGVSDARGGANAGTLPLVIFDEAYYEYARAEKGYPDTIEIYKKKVYPNLIIMRTFSKIYSLAGLRVGWAVANREIIDFLDRARPPFNVNSVAQAGAMASLKNFARNRKRLHQAVSAVREGREYLYRELEKSGFPFVSSAANFVLVDVSPRKGKEVFNLLLKKGIIVRSVDEYGFPNHIRVTVGAADENRTFIRKIKEIQRERQNDSRYQE